ncbi:hypothetical protein OS493_009064 [Desmophyllum pertusum]|uniref:Uncharacterized protein n=1 Tax=Desmophyllum pertusum TaxID=174260 RepID=A0A9W9ZF99_9CNID|nr:hypothetical protein OS493_009064 [Desmophyllum pertusum]
MQKVAGTPFTRACCCPQHSEWGYGPIGAKELYSVTYIEGKFCGLGKWSLTGHKERKRKICKFCRARIKLERKCDSLESAFNANSSTSQDNSFPATIETDDESFLVEPGPSCNEELLEGSSTWKDLQDKACQFPETVQSRYGYEALGDRRKRELMAEIMDEIDSLLENYTSLGSQGTCVIMRDILASQKFQYKFPDVFPMNSDGNDDKFLKALAKDYQASKDKETSKLIRAQGAKITQKLLIGGSLKGSNLQVDGVTRGKSRTETAKAIGRVSMFGDE